MGPILKQYENASKPGTFHNIRQGGYGVIYCDCWAWKRNKKCVHLDHFHSKKHAPVKFANLPAVREAIESAVMHMKGARNGN